MRTRIIVSASVIFTAVLILMTSANVFGCSLDEQNRGCGDSPLSGRLPRGEWELINPGQGVWYKLPGVGPRLDVWVDANGQQGLGLAVYKPDTQDFGGKPIGVGAFNKAVGKDLFWTGQSGGGGTWYAYLSNGGPISVLYRLSYNPENPAVLADPPADPPANPPASKTTAKPQAATISTNPKLKKPAVAPTAAPAKPAAPVTGSPDPNQAPAPTGDWIWIQAKAAVWFKANDGGRRLSVYINSNGQRGLSLDIFAPDQHDVWDTKPVGRGQEGKGFDLFWSGRTRLHGDWLVRVTNNNDFAVNYSLGTTLIADRAGDLCRACHGLIDDEWDRCEHKGTFCQDLQKDYRD